MHLYCGTTERPPGVDRFTDEHIVPLALAGTLILQQASCEECAKIINRQIESPLLRHDWAAFRAKYKFPTRNKASRKKITHVNATNVDGSPLRIPLGEHSTPILIYKFSSCRVIADLPLRADHLHWEPMGLADTERDLATQNM
jgi:hypothetical protein